MSLARIQRALAETQQRQTQYTKETEKYENGLSPLDVPQISLSWKRQTSSLSYPCPEPLPLPNLGALLFSLSGFPISKCAETFNVIQVEKASHVLAVVVENMSMSDLSEKPNMLSSFRRIVAENGFSVVLQPSLATAHTTGSDLSQVELSFKNDAAIIKTLLGEISGTRKLKSIADRNSDVINTSNHVEHHHSSDEAIHEKFAEPDVTDIKKRVKDFATRFANRHHYSVQLQDGNLGQTLLHPKKRHAASESDKPTDDLDAKNSNGADADEDGAPLSKISKPDLKGIMDRLEKLNREHIRLEKALARLQLEDTKDNAAQVQRLKDQLIRNEAEFKKAEEEWEQLKDSSQVKFTAEEEKQRGRYDLLKFLNRLVKQENNGLCPVGTVLPPGKLDRSKPEMFDRRYLLLSLSEMKQNGYNLDYAPSKKQYIPVTAKSRMFGIDCEMCLTANMTSELTRITVVNEDGVVLLDELVKPRGKIINYLTQFSGITPEMMNGVTTTREDIVRKLAEILPPDAILVGHSLDSDLKALCLTHPYCIDTSVCYSVKGGRLKSKLKVLMKTFFGEDIQTAGASGHSSAEDSFSALKLVILKLQHDISFGDIDMNPSFEWNGVNYTKALHEAMNLVSNERRTRIFQHPLARKPIRGPKALRSDIDPMALIGMTPEENEDYITKKEELRQLMKERCRQEEALREIQQAMRSQDEVGYRVFREHKRRLGAFSRLQANCRIVHAAIQQKLDALDCQRRALLEQQNDANGSNDRRQSTVVLLAKQRFLLAKIKETGNNIKGILPSQKSKLKQLVAKKRRLRDELKQVTKAIRAKDKEQDECSRSVRAGSLDRNMSGRNADKSNDDSNDEAEPVMLDGETDTSANLNEGDILMLVEESDRALQAIRDQEEELRKELERNEALARKSVLEMRIEKRHQDDENLAKRIVEGEVDLDEVFADEAVLQRFVGYQLFVQRKNEEFVRKRGYGFGTVALEKLYLNMFSAWKMAQKKSVVVAEQTVANIHYDDVKITPPKDSSISAATKTTRRCLATHDLVVTHLLYDDVHENEDEIDFGLCQLWNSMKSGGVVVVILEGSYHFKQIGLGLGMIAVKK